MTSSNCLNLKNNIDICNGKYVIENNYSFTSFELYDNSNNLQFYEILNIPKEYPLGFYIDSCDNLISNIYNDISSIIKYESNLSNHIKIYVSRGNDLSFNNGDYFRFYDESFNLLNISKTDISTNNFLLTASADNFYFMKGVSYEFISTFDFSSSSHFGISGDFLNSPLTLTEISENKILYIDNYSSVDNSSNKIYYYDLNKQNISGDLEFLIDSSGINYYYGDIKFKIQNSFPEDVSLSIKSYPKYSLSLSDISNKSLFVYNDQCNYVIENLNYEQYSLSNNDSECLTKISRADICLNNGKVFYEFNKKTHNSLIEEKLKKSQNPLELNNLKYGIYDGSYVIFDICENYPITISSEYIDIEENYIYSKKIPYYSNIIQNLDSIYDNYKIYNYYYGAIQFTLNSNGVLNNDFSFDLFIFDRLTNKISTDSSKILIYSDFCQGICGETNFLTNLNNEDFTFKLKNQAVNSFEQRDFSLNNNIYKLNKFDSYVELPNPYIIEDKYGHSNLENLDLINLVISSAPTDFSSTKLISNNFTNSFIITYNLTYFDLSVIQLTRLVYIIDDVFIEFSEAIQTKLFKNQTQYTNIIEINSNDIFDESFNFFNDLNVFIKQNKYDKIYLPYEITISGSKYNTDISKSYLSFGNDNKIINYNVIDTNAGNISFNLNNKIYYLTDNIVITKTDDFYENKIIVNTTRQSAAIKLKNIIDIILPTSNTFFTDISNYILNINNNNIELQGITNKLFDYLEIYDISSNIIKNSKNYNNYIYLHATKIGNSNVDISLIFNFYKNNNKEYFTFDFISNKNVNQNIINRQNITTNFNFLNDASFTISGEFLSNDFFKIKNSSYNQKNDNSLNNFNLIDTSFIGNYEFIIDVKGLQPEDFIFNELSLNRTDFSLSKIIYINLIDNQRPDLYFAQTNGKILESSITNTDTSKNFNFIIPYGVSFDILNSILFLNTKTASPEDYKDPNPNKPIIVYNENSIYSINKDLSDISYSFIDLGNVKENNNNTIQLNNNDIKDGSAIIVYKVTDLCNNISNDISLNLFFKDIPFLTICGEPIITHDVNTPFFDRGLFIDGNHFTGIAVDVSINEPSNNFFSNEIVGTTNYDISFSTDFSSSKIGTYEISYNIKFHGTTDNTAIAELRRTINVVDRIKPFVRLFDFSGTDFLTLDLSNISLDRLNTSVSENNIIRDTCYNNFTIDNSNTRIIDFSLTYLSSFNDLSKIIHAFELSDNYTRVNPNTGDFSINIILNISNIAIDFSNSNFSTNDLSYDNISYLNDDNSFIHVTQGIGSILPPLVFEYQIIDSCDNNFNFSRTVNIVDITKPTIDFSLITITNSNYIEYSGDKKDFSYQAFDYSKNNILFLQEISDIIFNFRIEDNYTENKYSTFHINNFNSMQNNYKITISANDITDISFKNFSDFSNQIHSNQTIRNLFKNFNNNSFELIYDFSDNQFNDASKTRIVNILNNIDPSINLKANSYIIDISFGDVSLNLNSFFNLSHPRLLESDLSFDLSYILPRPRITSISNNDISALIYQFQDASSRITINDISFFNIATKSNYYDLSSAVIIPQIDINIPPTNFEGFSTISHEAGVYLSDASLINGLTVTNEFDRFYYTYGAGSNDISYTGSIFDICNIRFEVRPDDYISFNEFQNDPSLIGQYKIKYSLTNQNNYTEDISRTLIIKDTIPPIFETQIPTNEEVNLNQPYIEPGITFSDYGSRLKKLDYVIKKNGSVFSQKTISDFANQTTGNFGITNSITLLNSQDTSNTDISYTITYIIYDNANNSFDISRNINVRNLNNLIITPIINYKTNFNTTISFSQELVRDFSSNSPINYDISFFYVHSSKTIFYEATTNYTFNQLIEFSYNYDLPENISLNDLDFFDPIASIIPYKVNNYLIFFQIFNNATFFNNLETINFNVIDNTKPKLTFQQNNEFIDICNIELPVLSFSAYHKLSNDINYFNKLEQHYPSFTKNKNNDIIFSIPGVKVDDIVDGNTTTLSNETFNSSFNKLYDISVNYEISGGLRDGSAVDASYLLTNSGEYIQKYIITDSNNNSADISRNIIIKQFNPFIELRYNIDICNNFYKKIYHKRYENYYDLDAQAYDFSYIDKNDLSFIIVNNNFNKNTLGVKTKNYIVYNKDDLSSNKNLDIHIVDISILLQDISLSSIIEDYNSNNTNNSNNENYKRYGVYKNNIYNISTDNSTNAFRIINDYSDNYAIFKDSFKDTSYSNLNNIVNISGNIHPFNNNNYYYGNVTLGVSGDFNRLSIEYLDTSGTSTITKTLKDIILYNQYFETQNLTSKLSESIFEETVNENSFNTIIVTVSNSVEYTDINDVNNAFYLEHNNEGVIERKTLYLPLGKYKFKQKDYSNFYNPIKFSYLPDGHFYDSSFVTNIETIDLCNIGLTSLNNTDISFSSFNDPNYQKYEYKRGVEQFGLAGFNTSENSDNGCTTLIISPTTPNPLFYYCKNFPKMGGIIYVTSNLVLYKNIINLNGNILTKENQTTISYENYETSYNEISNNLVFLSQHFEISNNNTNIFSKKKHHIIGLTQQNINHNIIFLKDTSLNKTNKIEKLIFKKYEDASKNQSLGQLNSDFSYISNYKITEDNSANYLYDFSASQLKTDILMYDFNIDTSFNITNTNTNYSYDYDINNIFFNSNELLNYYYYFKKYNLLQENFISTSFKYRIGEVSFFNPISIKNSDKEINFYDNLFFNNNNIVLEPLFQNKINLNLQVYIDPSSLTNSNQSLNYYNREKDKYNLSNYQNIIDPSKILFQEYFINILSDISGEFPGIIEASDQSIIFSNGNIELKDYLLDSSYTFNLLDIVHGNTINDLSLQDIIYLAFTEDISNNLFCGLTQQNIYHNMFMDDQDRFVFHPHRDNTYNNIYELNNLDNSFSRINNITKIKNEKNYLIEVSSNDLYNTLIPFDVSDNIYSKINVLNKNRHINKDSSGIQVYNTNDNFKFKTRVSYKIYDELNINDNKLNDLDIRPITLNDFSNIYQLYPYAYDSSLQETHSHSFKINLTEHIDRNFYNNPIIRQETGLTYTNIHYSKLYYVIKDISYNIDFNLYDSVNNQNILYDKNKIKTLNYLQSLIYIVNFKLDYYYDINFKNRSYVNNYNPNDYKLIGFTNYQDLTRLISGDFIDTTYSLELPNVSLNKLFATVLYNSKTIVNKYNKFANNYNNFEINLVRIIDNNNIYNFNNSIKKENSIDQIRQIENDILTIDTRINDAFKDFYWFNDSNIPDTSLNRYYILDQSHNTETVLLNEFKILLDLMIDFNKYKQEYNQINYELNLRGIIKDDDISNNDFKDLYAFDNSINGFYSALIDNMQKLNKLYLHDISNSNQVVKYITGEYWRVYYGKSLLTDININPEISFNNADFSSQFFIDLSNSVTYNGEYEFSHNLYNISYGKYDLSLLKYFSNEISKNNIVDVSNIEISYNNYYFYISEESYHTTNNSKDFSYTTLDYYHDSSINTANDPSGIGFLKEDSYVLNFNRSIYNQSIDEAYDHLTKSFNFDTINYILNGQELVINSFRSNNIVIEFDVYYNSYLYPNKYLDTIVLDMFIPDLTPPTILFKTELINISQSSLETDISSIAQLLINDISYIDINSNSNISFDDDISFSYRKIGETSMNYLDNNVDDSSFVNIYIDISQVANATRPDDIIYVYYTIYDNVNNMNIVKRRVNVVDLILKPIIFYYYAGTLQQYINENGEDKFDLLIKKGEMLTDNKIMENIRAKDTETDTFINLNNISYTLADGFAVNQIITLEPKTYTNVISYTATGIYNNIKTITRNIRVLEEDIIIIEPQSEAEKITHCCYPAVYYKPVQHNYKLGSSNSAAMRMAKFIINS